MELRGGLSASRRSRNPSRSAGGPSTSINTPWAELLTQPLSPDPLAHRYMKGRKPTPWTAPRTMIFSRALTPTLRMTPLPDRGWQTGAASLRAGLFSPTLSSRGGEGDRIVGWSQWPDAHLHILW